MQVHKQRNVFEKLTGKMIDRDLLSAEIEALVRRSKEFKNIAVEKGA